MKETSTKKRYKIISVFLAFNILFQSIAPTCAYALTGGPSQPEVESFTPVGTSDMVDAFTGDFSYNIPLFNVDGYPINIGYNAGVTMDQEASWVGLGWNINPGVIGRNMRGIPDDFNGEAIVKEMNMKPNKTYGFNVGAGLEVFGLGKNLGLGLNYSIGIKHNNYTGYGVDQSFSPSISSGDQGKGSLTFGLGLNSSSDDGLSLSPSLSYSHKVNKNSSIEQKMSYSVGCSFNSRAGLKALSIGSSTKVQYLGATIAAKSIASTSFDIGMPTYTPQVQFPMQNLSITGNFKLGFEGNGVHSNFTVGGFYSGQKLATNSISNPAYGYMNADEGTKFDNAILDFNREKDGSFTPSTPALPVTNFTYDIYSVSGQGVGGSYRPFRGDIGHVYDAAASSTSDGYSLGAEVGVGSIFHAGVDFTVNNVESTSGRWKNGNQAADAFYFKAESNNPLYEKYYFKSADDKSVDADPAFYQKIDGTNPSNIYLNQISKFNITADKYFSSLANPDNKGLQINSENTRQKRERRNQPFTTLNRNELNDFALENLESKLNTMGYNVEHAKPYHIGEITTLTNDGSRYVYGVAAYNKKQEEVTFAVGNNSSGTGARIPDFNTGLVKYNLGDNEITNVLGRDNYYSNVKTPAYAHSYLLTAVLSPDYVDSDNIRGPSKSDIGSYTKLNYNTKITDYNWRVPVGERQATYDEGLKSDKTDDKANYIFGSKDLYYLTSIETKNYIAVFSLSDREDGYGVEDKNGKLANVKPMKKLDKITLYAREDYRINGANATEIKTVNFVYDYSLCPGIPNNSGKIVNDENNVNINSSKGKLTLKKIFFTYQKSNKAKFSPYQFTYSTFNPSYNIKAYDRWGNYKPVKTDDLYSYEFPYVEQNKTLADQYSEAWNLKEINLPSGGKIKVEYESDDYAYVQNKQAGQMFKVLGLEYAQESSNTFSTPSIPAIGALSNLSSADNVSDGTRLIIKLHNPITSGTQADKNAKFQQQYLAGIDYLYFRFLMRIKQAETIITNPCGVASPAKDEYVSGYLTKNNFDVSKSYVDPSGVYGCIYIKKTDIDDNSVLKISPISKAAIQYGRINMSRDVWSSCPLDDTDGFGEQLAKAMLNSNFSKNIKDAIMGPNKSLYITYNVGKQGVMGKSWVRLNNPNKMKLGGGYRVKKVEVTDQWDGTKISDNMSNSFSYGQEYTYTLDDGTSSGVASYEPQLGGDENPLKKPVFYSEKKLLVPDDEHYMEEPFGESFFPSPVVGYSRVTIKNLQRANVTHNATGKTIQEFYTAKEFPTIVERTKLHAPRKKNMPLNIGTLLKLEVKDYLTASQGFVIEINDMHGKQKSQSVYQENQKEPLSYVEYKYTKKPYDNGCFRLDNKTTVINANGTVDNSATIGMFIDFVSDMRESSNTTISSTMQVNVDAIIIPPLPAPVPIPVVLPSVSREYTQFRSASVTKVIQRFGVLEEVVAVDLGSVVSTKNLAYDAESGSVLLSETVTNFDDKTYSLTYPAYWYYTGMGPAYSNVGFSQSGITFSAAGIASVYNALLYFAEGDEIMINTNGNSNSDFAKAWVKEVSSNALKIIDKAGLPVSGDLVKIIRSGKRNQQGLPMASIISQTNPINNISGNIYENVLNAQAIEYTNSWKTFCDCYQNGTTVSSSNPYVIGTRGIYKPQKSYSYLSGRTQSNYNNNSNIRKDGVFTSYNPFYKMNGTKWEMDGRDWTYASEVTEFSPFGVELENKDALNRYSSALFGYNQSLSIAVAGNSKYKNVGVDNFEDYDFKTCADNHFKFNVQSNGNEPTSNSSSGIQTEGSYQNRSLYYANIDNATAHSGKYSLKVIKGTPVKMVKQISDCNYIPCNISITKDATCASGQFCYTITGGVQPYQYEWSCNDADAQLVIGDSTNKIFLKTLNSAFQITLVIADNLGCKKTIVINASTGAIINPNSTDTKIK